jgi:hypothetical protein
LSDLGAFPPGFLWGDHTWFPGDSFHCDLAPSNPGLAHDLMFFGSTRVLHVHCFDSWIYMTEWIWGLDLLDIACPWGKYTSPKTILQSVVLDGRSIDCRLSSSPRANFLGSSRWSTHKGRLTLGSVDFSFVSSSCVLVLNHEILGDLLIFWWRSFGKQWLGCCDAMVNISWF